MSVLYYWRPDNYRRDAVFSFGYHLNQDSPALAQVAPGESVWAFTRNRDGRYVLAAEMVVRAVTRNPPNYRYGRYRVWGDLGRSRYFDVVQGPQIDQLVRSLGLRAHAEALGRSFQGHAAVRSLTADGHRLLAAFAVDLLVLAHVGIYPEDAVEAGLLLGEGVRTAIMREPETAATKRTAYLYARLDPQRARRNVEALQERYAGRCQLCGYDPHSAYGCRLCHGHHIQWLSRGGEDMPENMVLLCPNHHAAVHRLDAPFDYAALAFTFAANKVEALRLNSHLSRAN